MACLSITLKNKEIILKSADTFKKQGQKSHIALVHEGKKPFKYAICGNDLNTEKKLCLIYDERICSNVLFVHKFLMIHTLKPLKHIILLVKFSRNIVKYFTLYQICKTPI